MPDKSKLNSTDTLISQALIDSESRHDEFKTIVNEKEKYVKMKEDIKKEEWWKVVMDYIKKKAKQQKYEIN